MAAFLNVEQVAERYQTTPRSIHGRTRLRTIPFVKRSGFRHLLFNVDHLDAWDNGAELETVELSDGSLLVRPASATIP